MFTDFLSSPDNRQINLANAQGNLGSNSLGQIVLQEFVDIDWDARGWYAIGHHAPQQFIAVLAAQEPTEQLLENHVEHTWARINGQQIEWFDEPIESAQPVTILLLLEPL